MLSPAVVGIKRCRYPSVRLSVRLSVPPGPARHAAPSCTRPPELCGLQIRPSTDLDPPQSAEGISSRRAITCYNFRHTFVPCFVISTYILTSLIHYDHLRPSSEHIRCIFTPERLQCSELMTKFVIHKNRQAYINKCQLSQMDLRDALPCVHRAVHRGGRSV